MVVDAASAITALMRKDAFDRTTPATLQRLLVRGHFGSNDGVAKNEDMRARSFSFSFGGWWQVSYANSNGQPRRKS